MADNVPVMFEGNDVRLIPQDQVQMAMQNGGKVAQKMMFGDNDTRWIPQEEVDNARKAGGQLMGTSPSLPAQPEMKEDKNWLHAVAEGTPMEGFRTTLNREVKTLGSAVNPVNLGKGVYHAAVDPETQDESQEFGKGFETKIGPVGRVIDRTMAQPIIHAISDYAHGKVSLDQALSVLPEAAGTGGAAVLGGKVAEVAKAAIKSPGAVLPEGASGPATPSRMNMVGNQVGTNVPFTNTSIGDAVTGAAKSTVGKGASIAQHAASGAVAKAADALTQHVNNLKSDISDQIMQAIQRPSGNGMHADIQDAIEQSSYGMKHVMDNASGIASNILDTIKTNAKTAGDVSQNLVDKITNRMIDEYYLRKNPSVSGGSQGADFDPASEPEPTFRGTVNANSPEAVGPSPTTEGRTTPVINQGVGVGPQNQPLRTPLAALADQEDWAKPLNDALTRGQTQGGLWQKAETSVRRSPILGRQFEQGTDITLKNRITQMLRDASQDATLGNNARGILKGAAKDIDNVGRFNLAKTIQKIDDGLKTPGMFRIFGHPGQVIGDATPRMELLRDGLDQANKDIAASTRFGEMSPTSTMLGTAVKIAQHLGVKWMVKHLFSPSEMDESSKLIRVLSNVPRIPEQADSLSLRASKAAKSQDVDYTKTDFYKSLSDSERRLIDRKAESIVNRFKRVWRGTSLPGMPPRTLQPGQTPLPATHPEWNIASAHPGTHSFSFQQYLQNNPNASPDDAREAGRNAENAGYEVQV